MTKIVVSAETKSWTTRDPDPTDEWDNGDSAGLVTNVIAYTVPELNAHYGSSCGVELDGVEPGDTVYAIVADYESGCTFGRSGGHAQVAAVFATPEEAEALLRAINDRDPATERYGITFNGVEYHFDWVGYFDSLNDLSIWDVVVRSNPADPFRREPGEFSHRHGH